MDFTVRPAAEYATDDLARLLNQGFEEYFIPIHFTDSTFLNILRKDGIDLSVSRVLLADERPCGIALVAPRPARHASRLAAMGIARETRGKRAGSWLMKRLVDEARERGDREMVLEVIEQNEPAVRLYRNYGFEHVRRLIGCIRREAKEAAVSDLQNIDLPELAQLISQHGLPDLPWQVSGESIAQLDPAGRAYQYGPAYVAISNPESQHIAIWSLLVEPQARGRGLGTDMLRRVIARHPGKTWHVPALLPEELFPAFERAGFEREMLSQWQMRLSL